MTATFTAVYDIVLFAVAPLLGLVISVFGYPVMFLTVSVAVIGGIACFYRFDKGRIGSFPTTAGSTTAPVPRG